MQLFSLMLMVIKQNVKFQTESLTLDLTRSAYKHTRDEMVVHTLSTLT